MVAKDEICVCPLFTNDMEDCNFKLRRKTCKLDWKSLAGVDVASVARRADFATLQRHVRHVVYCDACVEFADCGGGGGGGEPDASLLKLFQLAQLIAEYLLQCQSALTASLTATRRQLQLSQQRRKKTGAKLERCQKELIRWRHYRKSCKNGKQCETCGKVFVSQTYLNSHIVRRHSSVTSVRQQRQPSPPAAHLRHTTRDVATETRDVTRTPSPSPTRYAPCQQQQQQQQENDEQESPDSGGAAPWWPRQSSDQLQLQLLKQRLSQVEQLLLLAQIPGDTARRDRGVQAGGTSQQQQQQQQQQQLARAEQQKERQLEEQKQLETRLSQQQLQIEQLRHQLARLANIDDARDSGGDTGGGGGASARHSRAASPGLVAPPSSTQLAVAGSCTTVFSSLSADSASATATATHSQLSVTDAHSVYDCKVDEEENDGEIRGEGGDGGSEDHCCGGSCDALATLGRHHVTSHHVTRAESPAYRPRPQSPRPFTSQSRVSDRRQQLPPPQQLVNRSAPVPQQRHQQQQQHHHQQLPLTTSTSCYQPAAAGSQRPVARDSGDGVAQLVAGHKCQTHASQLQVNDRRHSSRRHSHRRRRYDWGTLTVSPTTDCTNNSNNNSGNTHRPDASTKFTSAAAVGEAAVTVTGEGQFRSQLARNNSTAASAAAAAAAALSYSTGCVDKHYDSGGAGAGGGQSVRSSLCHGQASLSLPPPPPSAAAAAAALAAECDKLTARLPRPPRYHTGLPPPLPDNFTRRSAKSSAAAGGGGGGRGRWASLARALRRRLPGGGGGGGGSCDDISGGGSAAAAAAAAALSRHCVSTDRLPLRVHSTGSLQSRASGPLSPPPAAEAAGAAAGGGDGEMGNRWMSGSDQFLSDYAYVTADSQQSTPQRSYSRTLSIGNRSERKRKRPAPPLPPPLTV